MSCKAHAYGWLVSKDGKNYGFVSSETGNLVILLKYRGLWNGSPTMERFNGKIDLYDENCRLQKTIDVPKECQMLKNAHFELFLFIVSKNVCIFAFLNYVNL
jgi:hypothetical protein